MADLGSMVVRIGANTSGLAAGLAQATSLLQGFAGESAVLSGIGLGLAAVGVAAVAVGAVSTKMAADFQESMDKVQAYAGMTAKQTQEMSNSILALAPQLGVAPKAMADGLYFVASAGFRGADALNVLKYAGMTAAASNTDMTITTSALVAALNSMSMKGKDAGQMSDILNATVKNGIMSWQEYGAVVGRLGSTIAGFNEPAALMHQNFIDTNAALDIFTNAGKSAHISAMQLSNTLTELNNKTDTIAKNAKSLGISFDENKFKSMDFANQLKYLQEMTQGNSSTMLKLMGGNSVAASTVSFLNANYHSLGQTITSITGAMQHGKTTQDMFAIAQEGLNFSARQAWASLQSLAITIGQQLLPYITQIVQAVTPGIAAFAGWMAKSQALKVGIDGMITGIQVSIKWLVDMTNTVVRASQQFANTPGFQAFEAIMRQLGEVLVNNFLPVWHQLVDLWNSQLLPLFKQLWSSLQALTPLFILIGVIIGTVLVVALGLLVGVLEGVFKALAGLLSGLAIVFAGVVRLLTGTFQFIGGLVQFFTDLFTGHFEKLGSDLGMVWQGIVNMFTGVFQIIGGLFATLWYTVSGLVSGFVSGVIDFFKNLYNTLVGHSIIPDLVNGIIQWFVNLEVQAIARVISFVQGIIAQAISLRAQMLAHIQDMIAGITAALTNFAGQAVQLGANIINGVINGIKNAAGGIGNVMSGITNTIGSWLPHSPAKQGELSHLNEYGPSLVKGFAEGITRSIPTLQASLNLMTKPIAATVAPSSYPASSTYAPAMTGGSANQPAVINIVIDGRTFGQAMVPHIAPAMVQELRVRTGVRV